MACARAWKRGSAQPDDPAHPLANYRCHGITVTAAIRHGKVSGVQFHPEKSAQVGLRIIRNFVAAAGASA